MEVEDLQLLVESNKPEQIEDLKKKIYDQFNSIKESWLLNGLFDCYLQTSSTRLVEILVGVREPHDKHLFDKLSETLRGQSKLQALTLLGHVVRRHPTWLIKITQHQLLKELFKVLKTETDILLLMSALLVVIILLPMIPSLMAHHLQEIFDVFYRLAAWNTNNPNKVPEENLLHLQVGLCELFHRLYGMYPCNFLFFLRQQYSQRENLDVFSHTIKPMVCSVRMHPLLVTASKDAETAASRWKKMEDHDVIVECAKYVLDAATRDEPCPLSFSATFRSRSAMDYASAHDSPYASQQLSGRNLAAELALTYSGRLSDGVNDSSTHWSPSVHCGLNTPPPQESAPTSIPHTPVSQSYVASSSFPHQEGTSPPEAAIEATPETTPIKDLRHIARHTPGPTNVMRALNHSLSTAGVTSNTGSTSHKWPTGLSVSATSYSQPSSPMKKEPSPFRYSGLGVNLQLANAATPPPVLSSLAPPPPTMLSDNFSSTSAFQQPRRDSLPFGGSSMLDHPHWESTSITRRVASIVQDRKQQSSEIPSERQSSLGSRPRSNITNPSSNMQLPSSPLRVIPGSSSKGGIPPESPIPIEPTAPVPGSRDWPVTRPTPEFKNGARLESALETNRSSTGLASPHPHHLHHADSTQEDQEVVEIVRQGEQYRNDSQPINVQPSTQSAGRHCDSVLQEFSATHSQDHECELEGEECQQEASGSPCASGGLHMPNSVMNFTRRVHRMRYYSQCLPSSVTHHLLPDVSAGSTGSSPGEGASFPISTRVRRANSCPEMEKAALLPGTDVKVHRTVEEREELEESAQSEDATTPQNSIGDEVMVNGCGIPTHSREMISEGTQTVPLAPYEHLFLSVFSPMDAHSSPAQSPPPMPVPGDMYPHKTSPQAQLELYLQKVVENRSKGASSDSEIRLLKEQVMLLNIQLQFERQRREIHAERNRRLLGRSRNNRALEEHKNALKEQLCLLQHENEQLLEELTRVRGESRQRELELQESITYWQEECSRAQNNWRESKSKCDAMEQQLSHERDQTAVVQKELQLVQAKLFDASNEVRQAAASAAAAERLRSEVQHLQRELLLAGEQQQRLRERFQQFAIANSRAEESAQTKEAYHDELHSLRQLLDARNSLLDATKARVAELESTVNNTSLVVAEQKRQLKCVKDEYSEQLQAVESKYQAQKKIIQRLQEENLELLHKRDIAELRCRARKRDGRESSASQPAATSSSSHASHPKSPDSVCSDDRLPHSSSPLSESLSSSEGMSLSGILARDVVTMQNLQVIVDQPEHQAGDMGQPNSLPVSPSKSTSGTTNLNPNARDEG